MIFVVLTGLTSLFRELEGLTALRPRGDWPYVMPVISANGRSHSTGLAPGFALGLAPPARENRPGKIRIVKDVLRVGTWTWSEGEAMFSAEDLASIADSFARQKVGRILRPQWITRP